MQDELPLDEGGDNNAMMEEENEKIKKDGKFQILKCVSDRGIGTSSMLHHATSQRVPSWNSSADCVLR